MEHPQPIKEIVDVTDGNGKKLTILVTESQWEIKHKNGKSYVKGTIEGYQKKD